MSAFPLSASWLYAVLEGMKELLNYAKTVGYYNLDQQDHDIFGDFCLSFHRYNIF